MALTLNTNTIEVTGQQNVHPALASITGVITTHLGLIPVYILPANMFFNTQTISDRVIFNPEECMVVMDTFQISTGLGTTQFGETIVNSDGSTRPSRGVAVFNNRAQSVWWGGSFGFNGGNCSLAIKGTAGWEAYGATVITPGMFAYDTTAHIYIKDLEWVTKHYLTGVDIDPLTGVTVATNVGFNTGITNAGNTLSLSGRSYVGWLWAADARIENLLLNGTEADFLRGATGTNTISGLPNGYFGVSAINCPTAILIDAQGNAKAEFYNLDLSNKGNTREIGLQGGSLNHEGDYFDNLGGLMLKMLGAENGADNRNWGYQRNIRQIDFNYVDADTNAGLTGGGIYIIDTNNGERKTRSTLLDGVTHAHDDTSSLVYSSQFSNGALVNPLEFVMGIVNVQFNGTNTGGTSNDPQGTIRTADLTRTSATVQTLGGVVVPADDRIRFLVYAQGSELPTTTTIIATSGQTAYNVDTLSTDTVVCQQVFKNNIIWTVDVRCLENTIGEGRVDIHLWRYEDDYKGLNGTLLTDGVKDKLEVFTRNSTDSSVTSNRTVTGGLYSTLGSEFDVTDTTLTTGITSLNLDQIFDLVKWKKSETTKEAKAVPTPSTLILDSDGTVLDLGTRTLSVNTPWTVGANHKTVKRTTTYDASQIVQHEDLIIDSPLITNLPAIIKGSLVTGAGDNTSTGGKTFNVGSLVDSLTGQWELTTSGNTLNGTFNSDLQLTGAGNNTLNGPLEGDTDFPAGNQTFGAAFVGTGNLDANGNGDWTFDAAANVEFNDVVVESGVTINIFGKVSTDFNSVSGSGTVNFPIVYENAIGFPVGAKLLTIFKTSDNSIIYESSDSGTILSDGSGVGKTVVDSNTAFRVVVVQRSRFPSITNGTTGDSQADITPVMVTNTIAGNATTPPAALISGIAYATGTNLITISLVQAEWRKLDLRDRNTDTFLNEMIGTALVSTDARARTYSQFVYYNSTDSLWFASNGFGSYGQLSLRFRIDADAEIDLKYIQAIDANGDIRGQQGSGSNVTAGNDVLEGSNINIEHGPSDPSVDETVRRIGQGLIKLSDYDSFADHSDENTVTQEDLI